MPPSSPAPGSAPVLPSAPRTRRVSRRVVHREARAARRSVEVVAESGNRLSVYGSSCAEIGETAFRHGVLVHRLTDEVGDTGPDALVPPHPPRGRATGAPRPTPPAGPDLRPSHGPSRAL